MLLHAQTWHTCCGIAIKRTLYLPKGKAIIHSPHPGTFTWIDRKLKLINCAIHSGEKLVKVTRSCLMLKLVLMSSQLQRCVLVVSAACQRSCQTHTWYHTPANAAAKWPHRWSQLLTRKRSRQVKILASKLKALKGKWHAEYKCRARPIPPAGF